MEPDPLLRVSNRLRSPIALPGIVKFGTWELSTWDNRRTLQHGALLVSDHAPWRDLFSALDQIGTELSSAPLSEIDEADAIVAACWLYGSYVHMLTCGELYPPFRADPDLSRISDMEMKRVNIEFSAGLATWWDDRDRDLALVNRRARAALQLLPMPWRAHRKDPGFDRRFAVSSGANLISRLGALPNQLDTVADDADEIPNRRAANWAVEIAYRNGPVEDVHAGSWSHGRDVPGFVRLYTGDIERIAAKTSSWLAALLAARAQPGGWDVLQVAARTGAPVHWSLTDVTAPVEFYGLPGAGSLDRRLRWLSGCFPGVYEYGGCQ